MEAYSSPGLVETLSLTAPDGTVIGQQLQADAALSEMSAVAGQDEDAVAAADVARMNVLLVNTDSTPGSQCRGIAARLADLLCSSGSSSVVRDDLSKLITVLLLHAVTLGQEEAELELQSRGVGQIPADLRPWALLGEDESAGPAGSAQSAAKGTRQIWAGDDDLDDTASSGAAAAEQLAAAEERARSAAQQEHTGNLALSAAAAAAAAGPVAAVAATAGAGGASMILRMPADSATGSIGSSSSSSTAVAASSRSSSHAVACGKGSASAQQQAGAADSCAAEPHTSETRQVHGSPYGGGRSGRTGGGFSGLMEHSRSPGPRHDSCSHTTGLYGRASSSGGSGRGHASSSMQYTRTAVRHSRTLRVTEEGLCAFSAPVHAAAPPPADDGRAELMMQQALSAGQAAGKLPLDSFRQVRSTAAISGPLPIPPDFLSTPARALWPSGSYASSPAAASAAAPTSSVMAEGVGAASSTGMPPPGWQPAAAGSSRGQGALRIACRTEFREDVIQSVTETMQVSLVDAGSSSSSSSSSSRTPAGMGLSSSAGHGMGTGRSSNEAYAELTGAAGEVFLYGWLSQQLPGFSADNWRSGNRACLPGPEQLLRPEQEPSYDFLYTDTAGALTGKPGTVCYIECKATTADLSRHLMPMPITSNEWELAQRVHQAQLAGEKVQYMMVRVDRVGQSGGPRVAAVLFDPVQLLAAGQLSITGEQLRIEGYP